VQDLHLVASSVEEQEQLTGQRIDLKALGENGGKCVKALAYVGRHQSDEDAGVTLEADHGCTSVKISATVLLTRLILT
jgi:hypothetical protein